ncbi:MAG TPA: cytochrome c oxidase subunit II [Patescibacteria group bacterium]|nr:cytochrome c oxidase subunit II [Patescibacteria group bacterium]
MLGAAAPLAAAPAALAFSQQAANPNIFAPASLPAHEIYRLALFVIAVTIGIFVVVGGLLAFAIIKFRRRKGDNGREPAQVYGSTQIELAWTVLPVLIVVVLFLTTARVIHQVEDAKAPADAVHVTVVGHQFWWEFRYPQYGVVTANELHVPVGGPTYLTLLSADTDHAFWVPQLAGKTDLIPNRANHTWIEPERTGVYLGQCALFCGVQHAHMLLRVSVQSRAAFAAWIRRQHKPAAKDPAVAAGRHVFETTACVNCHTIRGTIADGRFGPDLTHLMSRKTLGAGVLPNTPKNLRLWIENPAAFKPGCEMPAMNLNPKELDELVSYLETLR